MTAPIDRPTSLAKIGRAVLRLRLFFGWSQAELGRRAKLSQGTISRLERGLQRGLSIRRLAAVMDALHVGEVSFERPPTVPRTDLEIMLFGDPWKRAVEGADRRLRWPVPKADGAGDDFEASDEAPEDEYAMAWADPLAGAGMLAGPGIQAGPGARVGADVEVDDDGDALALDALALDALAGEDVPAGQQPAAWFGGGG